MELEECPICECEPPSDTGEALLRCTLCNMRITGDPVSSPAVRGHHGQVLYFCCDRCREIYISETEENHVCLETLNPMDDTLTEFDEAVKEMVMAYISRKYPKDKSKYDVGYEGAGDTMKVETTAVLTCPECGDSYEVEMPVDRCQISYICPVCGGMLRTKQGDCCVFCSYADRKCPSGQMAVCGGGGDHE